MNLGYVFIILLFTYNEFYGVIEAVTREKSNSLDSCLNVYHLTLETTLWLNQLVSLFEEGILASEVIDSAEPCVDHGNCCGWSEERILAAVLVEGYFILIEIHTF